VPTAIPSPNERCVHRQIALLSAPSTTWVALFGNERFSVVERQEDASEAENEEEREEPAAYDVEVAALSHLLHPALAERCRRIDLHVDALNGDATRRILLLFLLLPLLPTLLVRRMYLKPRQSLTLRAGRATAALLVVGTGNCSSAIATGKTPR